MATMQFAIEGYAGRSVVLAGMVVALDAYLAPQPVVAPQEANPEADVDAYVDWLAEQHGYGPGLERFDSVSAHWGHD